MNREQTIKLLEYCLSLFNSRSTIANSVARDLYDYVNSQTTDLDISYNLEEARLAGNSRRTCIVYLLAK
jgi:hypothetical protein